MQIRYILLFLSVVNARNFALKMKSDLRTRLKEIVATEYGNDSSMSYSMDSLQSGMGCCGSLFFEDWSLSSWGKSPNILTNKLQDYTPVPDSCCKNTTAGCGYRSHPSNIYYDVSFSRAFVMFWGLWIFTENSKWKVFTIGWRDINCC